MGLFGRKRDAGPAGPASAVGFALPAGSTASATDLEHWLRAWSGTSVGTPLPASLTWTGPLAADPAAGEPGGSWVYTLSWDPVGARATTTSSTPDHTLVGSDLEAAIDLLQWIVDLRGRTDEEATAGRRAYAEAAASGLARRTDGLVRLHGAAWAAPVDPEATASVYLGRRPEAAEVAQALVAAVPGLGEVSTGLANWVLEAPDGRGLWLEELELDDDTGALDPSTVALCALAAVPANPMWVVRVEGATDTADAVTRADLDALARTTAAAIGGLAVDVDGFPL